MTSGYPYPGQDTETARQMAKAFDELDKNTNSDNTNSLRGFTKTLAAIPLAFDPGSHWMYGMSHDILGAFIESYPAKLSANSCKDEIFDPLGMKDTSFRIAEERKSGCAACMTAQTTAR